VYLRKLVHTTLEDGRSVAVNAQQYAVLVMDVPDLRMQRRARSSVPLSSHARHR
jgi:hypothetical protein